MATSILNTKIEEVENKIPATSNLVTTPVLNIKNGKAENKIPVVSNLVKKSDIFDLVKNSDLNTKLASLARRAELKVEQDKIVNCRHMI